MLGGADEGVCPYAKKAIRLGRMAWMKMRGVF